MKIKCDIIRDLLPLYADDACSEESRRMVDEHLEECADCGRMLEKLKNEEIESDLKSEKQTVIEYASRFFRRRSATIGSSVSGLFMIPILVFLILNLTAGSSMGWFFILLAAMTVAASLIVVPLMAPADKAFWTFCAFTACLILLLAVTCLVSRGDWFWVASSAVLFGLSVVFLPFVIRARPLKPWVEKRNKVLLVLAADGLLFVNMINTIRIHGRSGNGGFLTLAVCLAGAAALVNHVLKNRDQSR